MQKLVTVNALSGTTPGTANLFIQEGYYLQSVACKSPAPCVGYVWLEYFYDRNETTFGEVLTRFWVRNTPDYDSHPAVVVNKQFESELSSVVFHVLNQSATDNTYVFVVTFGLLPSHQVSHYDLEEQRGIWCYDQRAKRITAGGTLTFTITPVAGTWFDIKQFNMTPVFASVDDMTLSIRGKNNRDLARVCLLAGQTVGQAFGPALATSADDAATVSYSLGLPDTRYRVMYPNYIYVATSAVDVNDTLCLRLQCYLKSVAPVVTITNSIDAGYAEGSEEVV